MAARSREYGDYRQWLPAENAGAKGTLLWEAAKHVGEPMGLGKNPFFLTAFGAMFLRRLEGPAHWLKMLKKLSSPDEHEIARTDQHDLVQTANIGHVERDKPSLFHMAAYLAALLTGASFGGALGSEYGTIIGFGGAILGAVVCSTLVGVVAILFGYRP